MPVRKQQGKNEPTSRSLVGETERKDVTNSRKSRGEMDRREAVTCRRSGGATERNGASTDRVRKPTGAARSGSATERPKPGRVVGPGKHIGSPPAFDWASTNDRWAGSPLVPGNIMKNPSAASPLKNMREYHRIIAASKEADKPPPAPPLPSRRDEIADKVSWFLWILRRVSGDAWRSRAKE